MRKYLTKSQKQRVLERADYSCEYCLSRLDASPLDPNIEHIQPIDKGGTNALDNLALSCPACNSRKYVATNAVDPETGNLAALYNPRRDEWSAHFSWSDDKLEILGLTPTGRATVARLELNQINLKTHRRLLLLGNLHPTNKK